MDEESVDLITSWYHRAIYNLIGFVVAFPVLWVTGALVRDPPGGFVGTILGWIALFVFLGLFFLIPMVANSAAEYAAQTNKGLWASFVYSLRWGVW
jgi:hypothetical protein